MQLGNRKIWIALLIAAGVLVVFALGTGIGRDLALRDNAAQQAG
ncbi:MAG TPA: hypothetical protein VM576_04165 [Xanthomonadaceae bacterium]|jgi:hypothetical protein|nr:hypothetical protein [Xanthomonadaceae bacterium]